MKIKRIRTGFLVTLIALAAVSCKKETTNDTPQSEEVKNYLELKTKMSAIQATSGQMNNFMDVIAASQLNSNGLSLESNTGDSVVKDSLPVDDGDFWNYWTCATVTETNNGDGTITTVYDYGDGCEEYGSMMRGKISYIWRNTENNYYSKVIYENYYSWGMEMDGYSEYSFTSSGDSYFEYTNEDGNSDSVVSPGIVFNWSGTSTGNENMTVTFDNGDSYSYTSLYNNEWDNSSYTLLEGEYTYISQSAGYEYSYYISVPLVYNYECTDTWVPVSGIEEIHYVNGTETYDFVTNYGNGSCDNLAEVTENGITTVVDFGDLYTIYAEENADGTVTNRY